MTREDKRRWKLLSDQGHNAAEGPIVADGECVKVMPVAEHERIVDALVTDEMEEAARLRAAIVEHRAAVRAAGDVRVDSLDVPRAQAKRLADARLWRVIDEHV